MIILIGAAGSTGKTLLAQHLLEKYHIPYLSIDHLKMGIYRAGKSKYFTPLDGVEVIADELWPILKGMIMTAIENKQHMIIEGCYILPHYLKEIPSEYMREIIPVFMGFSVNYIKQNFETKIIRYRNRIEYRKYPMERSTAELIREHQGFKERCQRAGIAYFEVEENYEQEITKIYDYIANEIIKIKDK